MDASVTSGFFASRSASWSLPRVDFDWLARREQKKAHLRKRLRRHGSSAASPFLADALWHRRRRGSLHPIPWRSQCHLTPFFSSLLGLFPGFMRFCVSKSKKPAGSSGGLGVARFENSTWDQRSCPPNRSGSRKDNNNNRSSGVSFSCPVQSHPSPKPCQGAFT